MPQGIIKSGWASKHLNEIPSAVVVFFSLNWTSADWNEKKLECAQRIKSLKYALKQLCKCHGNR